MINDGSCPNCSECDWVKVDNTMYYRNPARELSDIEWDERWNNCPMCKASACDKNGEIT